MSTKKLEEKPILVDVGQPDGSDCENIIIPVTFFSERQICNSSCMWSA